MISNSKRDITTKFLGSIFVLIVLAIIILNGPANAFNISINLENPFAKPSIPIKFHVSLAIPDSEIVPVNHLVLEINGPQNIICEFYPNASKISGCEKLTILQTSSGTSTNGNRSGEYSGTEYQWGYGPGLTNGNLNYDIVLDSSGMSIGNYTTKFKAIMAGGGNTNVFSASGSNLLLVNSEDFNKLVVYSPINTFYGARMVPINLTANSMVDNIKYSKDSNFRTLCKDCNEFGFEKLKRQPFDDGKNTLIIQANFPDGQKTEEISFVVDTHDPKILKISPIRGFTDGKFEVEFQEANPKSLILNFGNKENGYIEKEVDILKCENASIRRNTKICSVEVNLTKYDNQKIEYYFKLIDIRDVFEKSKVNTLSVDLSGPIITYYNHAVKNKRVEFTFKFKDNDTKSIKYTDNNGFSKPLCTSVRNSICNKTKIFSSGQHNLKFEVSDEAGNIIYKEVSFVV